MGTRSVKKLPMDEAAALLRSLGIKTLSEFKSLKQKGERPPTIPANPETYYKDYPGWRIFISLGKDIKSPDISTPTYAELKTLNFRFSIKTQQAYLNAIKEGTLPVGSPTNPESYFKEHWQSWNEFLAPKSKFVSFDEARRYARQLGLKSSYEWRAFCRQGHKPEFIPVLPDRDYDEFISWHDFLIGDDN
jgi:hypothetical protein